MSEQNQQNTTPTAPAAQAATAKKVKIKLLRDAMIGKNIELAGTVHVVDEATAKELCDKKFPGYHPFYGTMPEIGPLMGDVPNPLVRKEIVRAVRVA